MTPLQPNRPIRRLLPETSNGRPLVLVVYQAGGQTLLTVRPKYKCRSRDVATMTLKHFLVRSERPSLGANET